jgi:hypothetical protein
VSWATFRPDAYPIFGSVHSAHGVQPRDAVRRLVVLAVVCRIVM